MNLELGLKDPVNVDGNIVERDALHIVEEIKRYDANLDVVCLDPARANFNEAPFILVETCEDGRQRRVFEFWELDKRILDRIRAADRNQGVDVQELVNKINGGVLLGEARRYEEQREADKDLVSTLVKVAARKTRVSYKDDSTGEKVTIFEDRPATRG